MTIHIDAATLEADARGLFEDRGAFGCEGTAMIASNGTTTRLVIPDQEASPVPHCTVTVTTPGKLALAAALGAEERYVARIHSHPALAFHSLADNANPAITHEGALMRASVKEAGTNRQVAGPLEPTGSPRRGAGALDRSERVVGPCSA